MSITWTKEWSSSDDGTILYGADLENIQTAIETYLVHLSGSQTVTGNKTFSGTNTHSGTSTFTGTIVLSSATFTAKDKIAQVAEFICYEDNVVCYDNNIVYLHA